MKKYILLILIFVALKSVAHIPERVKIIKPPHIEISFDIAARKEHCESGIGICHGGIGLGRPGGDGRNVSGEAYIEDGMLFVVIKKEYITPALKEELSNLSYFEMSDGMGVPEIWLEKMGIPDSWYIPEGRYIIVNEKDYFQITFNLR